MSLSKETRDRIEKESEAYVKGLSFLHSKKYKKEGYETGALHEAGRSQGLVYALEMVLSVTSWMEDNAYKHEIRKIAKEAIAKYKEVTSEPG